MAPTIKVGDTIPEATFNYIPYTPELESKLAALISHQAQHLPMEGQESRHLLCTRSFHCEQEQEILVVTRLEKYDEFKAKGVDTVAVVAANDAFVLSGWGRFEGVGDKILLLSDGEAKWSASLGLSVDLSAIGFGVRTGRYALILDDLVVKYVELEPGTDVTVSGAEAVLAQL